MLIDTHAHLDMPQFDNDREDVILRAKQKNITIINSLISPDKYNDYLIFFEKFDNLFLTLGLAPVDLEQSRVDLALELIETLSKHDKIAGIGEVGLDYYWVTDENDRKIEIENFYKFIELSNKLNLPLIVHSRDAEEDSIEILKESARMPVLLHCFSGSSELATSAASGGFMISIPTNVVYSKKKKRMVESLPIESIVLETDAPYLSCEPKTRNEPVNIIKSAKEIAQLKKMSFEEVARITSENARRFFNLPDHIISRKFNK